MKHEPMTQERLDAIQARVDGATGGPWGCYGDGAHEVFDAGEYSDGDRGEVVAAVIDKLSDAVFIAEAREDIPALLAEVKRLRALTTVDEDMVERAARASYGPVAWGRLLEAGDDPTSIAATQISVHRAMTRAVLDAALSAGGTA